MKSAVFGALALTTLPLHAQTLTQRWSNLVTDSTYPSIEGRLVKTGPDGQVVSVYNGYNSTSSDDLIIIKSDASTGAKIWQSSSNSPANSGDIARGIAIDSQGDIIVVGSRVSQLIGKPMFFAAKYAAATGAVLWQRIFQTNGYESFVGVAVDSQNNVIATGTTRVNDSSPIDSDIITYKFDATSGATLWQSQYSAPDSFYSTESAKALALDASGNVFVTGTGSNGTRYEAVTLKLAAADGKSIWMHLRNDANTSGSSGEDIAVDPAGNVVVVCSTPQGFSGFRTVKYRGSDGAQQWMNVRRSSNEDFPNSLGIDPQGDVVVTGYTYVGSANDDLLTLKISGSSGTTLWTRTYDGGITSSGLIKDDHGIAVRFDPYGNPVVAGRSNAASGNGPDTVVIKYEPGSGTPIVLQRIAVSTGDDLPLAKESLDVGRGHITVTGRYYATGGANKGYTFRLNDPAVSGVTTVAAGTVGSTTAQFRSKVQPYGSATTVRYYYGTSATSLTQSTAERSVGNGFAAVDHTEPVTGLLPSTTYFYQARVISNSQTVSGQVLQFTTLSNDATLAGLTVSPGSLTPAFSPATTIYGVTLPNTTTAISATPTVNHSAASLTVNGAPLTSGATLGPVSLPVGNTTIDTVVTAEDGTTTRTYAVIVTRVPEKYTFTSAADVPVRSPAFNATGFSADIELAFAPSTGTDLMMVEGTGPAFITGRFSNLEHGQEIILRHGNARYRYVANYFGGDGNDLVLTWANRKPYAWGYNNNGQLGLGTMTDAKVPTAITIAPNSPLAGKVILSLATGYSHTLALCSDGTLFAWGSNNKGQLGNGSATGTASRSLVPVDITQSGALAGKRVIAISAGTEQSFALCSDGSIAGWGWNTFGLLGDGSTSDRTLPTLVNPTGFLAGKQVVSVSTGQNFTYALCSDGSIAGWGSSIRGVFGSTAPTSNPTPVEVTRNGALLGKQVTSALAGADGFSMIRCSDGTAAGLGWNNGGQLGNGGTSDASTPIRVVTSGVLSGRSLRMVSPGYHHCVGLTNDGVVVTWGENILGTLGNNSTINSSVPVAVVNSGALAGKSVVSVNGNFFNSAALCSDGSVIVWGYGGYGALGNGTTATSNVPVAASLPAAGERFTQLSQGNSATHYLALAAVPLSNDSSLASLALSTGTLDPAFSPATTTYTAAVKSGTTSITLTPAANHAYAEVTVNGMPVPRGAASQSIPIQPGNNLLSFVVSAESGATTTYQVTVHRPPLVASFDSPDSTGTVEPAYSASGNTVQLSLGFAPAPGTILTVIDLTGPGLIDGEFTNLTQGQRVVLVHAGIGYEFVANYYGGTGNDLVLQWAATQLAGWGANRQGQLGDGTIVDRLAPIPADQSGVLAGKTITAVTAGYLHSLALCSDGTLAAWGYNVHGELGNGGNASVAIPAEVDRTGVLAGKTVIAVAAGSFHNLALCSDGTLAAWGYNNHGQLGTGDTVTRRSPVRVEATGALAGKRITGIAAGAYQSFAWCADGSAFAWGFNDDGELGDGTQATTSTPVAIDATGALAGRKIITIAAGQYHALALCEDGTLASWGYNQRGQLGNLTTSSSATPIAINAHGALAGKNVSRISAGGAHSLVLCRDHTLVAWGWNASGQLGITTGSQSTVPVAIPAMAGPTVGIATGNTHSLTWLTDGTLSAWGSNASGQLGDGTTTARSQPIPVNPSAFDPAARFMFATSGSSSSHNLAVMGLPHTVGPSTLPSDSRLTATAGSSNADADHDGIPDLIEYAFGLNPAQSDAGALPQPVLKAGQRVIRFTRPAGVSGVIYGAEWSPSLRPDDWHSLPDTGEGEEHVFILPDAPRGFIRLLVNPD